MLVFFFFKQKTAYEMRISDWSSDVCSSDLGALYLVPYHEEFAAEVQRAAALLEKAAVLAEDKGLRDYLELRAKALRTDLYRESDLAWLDMKDNTIGRSEEHTSELQSLMRISYAVFCLKKKNTLIEKNQIKKTTR